MKTTLLIEVTHTKPLPKQPITDVAGQRIYGWLYSQGVEAGVKASLLDDAFKPEPGEVREQ